MRLVETVVYISAALFWILLLGGWNSVYIQRSIAAFLIARSEAIGAFRTKMTQSLEKQWEVLHGE